MCGGHDQLFRITLIGCLLQEIELELLTPNIDFRPYMSGKRNCARLRSLERCAAAVRTFKAKGGC
jgi:hypothetical protein